MDKKNLKRTVAIIITFVVLALAGLAVYYYMAKVKDSGSADDSKETNQAEVIDYEDESTEKKEENMQKAEPDTQNPTPVIEGTLPEGSVVVPAP